MMFQNYLNLTKPREIFQLRACHNVTMSARHHVLMSANTANNRQWFALSVLCRYVWPYHCCKS